MPRVLLSPRMLGLHLAAVVAVAATILLGLWQYGAWETNRQDQSAQRAEAPPKPIDHVMTADAPFPASAVGRQVSLAGVWLPHDTFYVSGKRLQGRPGYWAVTPVAVCGHDCAGGGARRPAMLVVRGWTPRPGQAPAAPAGPVEVTGWLQPAESAGGLDPHPGDAVVPELSIATVIQRVDQDLYGGYVVSRSHEPGLHKLAAPVLPAPDTFTAVRNLLYALQWWVFTGFAVFLWWRWCSDEVGRDREERGDPDHAAAGSEAAQSGVASRT